MDAQTVADGISLFISRAVAGGFILALIFGLPCIVYVKALNRYDRARQFGQAKEMARATSWMNLSICTVIGLILYGIWSVFIAPMW